MENGMTKAVKNFPSQFTYRPEIQNAKNLKKADIFIISGMGGSHLSGDIMKVLLPEIDIRVHSDYGLPEIPAAQRKRTLVILSSYSGNTEEALDGFYAAKKAGFPMAAISIGGGLVELAKEHKIPYVLLPDTGVQPRAALGFSLVGLLKILGKDKMISELSKLARALDAGQAKAKGEALGRALRDRVPVIYSSARNFPIAYNWKIKFNETGKIPAFYNVFPELNHNEMTGFDAINSTKSLSKGFHFIFLRDKSDHPRIQKRMSVLKELYEMRGLPVEVVELKAARFPGEFFAGAFKIFSSLMCADWTALSLAEYYGTESDKVPMVEEFKKLI